MYQLVALLAAMFIASNFAQAQDVQFSPASNAPTTTQQIKVAFPQAMMNVNDAFNVQCVPEVAGDGYWADNNTTWVYNFNLPKDDYGDPLPMSGGTVCSVTQNEALMSVTEEVFAQGSLQHKFAIEGPFLERVWVLPGNNYKLRETNPVMFLAYTGEIDRDSLYNGGTFMFYKDQSAAPASRISVQPIPQAQTDELFEVFKEANSWRFEELQIEKDNTRWAIVTLNRDLIPGAEMELWSTQVKSAYNSSLQPEGRRFENIEVRDNFKVTVSCSRADESSPCLPESSPQVQFNAEVPWEIAKNVKIEYVPQGKNQVTKVASPKDDSVAGSWASWVLNQIDFDLENSDATVTNLDFSHVKVAPETQVRVIFPDNMADVDGRQWNESSYILEYGSYSESIRMASGFRIMERLVPGNNHFPVVIMNLNQKVTATFSGQNSWQPVTDVPTILNMMIADQYNQNNSWKEGFQYVSPIVAAGVSTQQETNQLTGKENTLQLIEYQYATDANGVKSGVYALELSSELMGDQTPKFTMANVTDLAIHVKKGNNKSLIWVTSMSSGDVIPQASIEVYGCDKAMKVSGMTNADGLFEFSNSQIPSCDTDDWFLRGQKFFVSAKTETDMAMVQSDQTIYQAQAMNAPGIEYFYSPIQEGEINYQTVIGVNLVKPGQTVPVKIVANRPTANGFESVSPAELPQSVNITYSQNDKISYKFDLNWNNGAAEFKWSVPKTAELGSYRITYTPQGQSYAQMMGQSDIEVSEFKIPLMSANLDLPAAPMLKPTSIEIAGMVQYANGVGAKDLAVDFSYYFTPTSLDNTEGFDDFSFARGKFDPNGQTQTQGNAGLPSSESVAQLSEVTTDDEGTVKVDLAGELAANNETVATLLANATRPYSMVVRMKYQDQMGEFQTLSAARTVYNASSYLGSNVVAGPQKEAALQAVILGLDGKPYTNMADLEMNVLELKANVVGEELFGGFIKNNLTYEVVPTSWNADCAATETGAASCAIGDLEFGSYIFEVASKTSGQVTYSKFTIDRSGEVTGESGGYWSEEDPEALFMVNADKETYEGGDVAKLNFNSPYSTCTALVSLERGDVYEAYVDNKACENGYVTVPVESELAPNVFASIYLVKERVGVVSKDQMDLGKPSYRIGFSNLKIDWSNYAAEVDVSLDKSEYKPGETAQVSIQVQPQEGQLLNPEATLIVVEEKILEMKENKTMELLAAMMGLRGHSVELINGYDGIDSSATEASAVLAEAALGGDAKAGEEGGDGSDMETFKRKLFDALVTWQTDIPVINGQAQVSFKLNDSLTKFKVFAVVQDSSEKFGTGAAEYLSAQEVQSYPNMPPVARTGDKFPVTVTLQNNGAADGDYTVTVDYSMLDANGEVISSGQITSSQTVGSASSKPVKVGDLEVAEGVRSVSYNVVVTDAAGNVVDSVEPEAQSIQPAIPLSVQEEFMVQIDEGSVPFTFAKDPKALAGQGMINAQVFDSLVNSTREKVKQDIADNPWAELTIENKVIAALVKNQGVSDVFAELVSQIDDQGFIKYYPRATKGSFWMTAEVVKLIGAFDAADQLPENLKAQLESGMQKALTGQLGEDYLAQNEAVAAYSKVKALNAMGALNKAKAETYAAAVVDAMSSVAMETLPVSALTEMAQGIAEFAPGALTQSEVFTYITGGKLVLNNKSAKLDDAAAFSWWGYSDETIGTAKLVQALSLEARTTGASSADNYLDNLVTGIVNANKAGAWYTMRTQAWVVAAMMEFAKTYESVPVSGQTQVKNSESISSSTVVWDQNNTEGGISTDWKTDEATVTFTHNGDGQPWASVTASSAVKLEGPNYKGIQVSKTVENVTRQDGSYQAGDLINVTVKVSVNGPVNHVALFDPIPGGANILSEGWGGFSSAQPSYAGYKVYFSYLPAGDTEVSYQYQLNNPGTFNVSPTRAEALYEPGFFGEIPNPTMEVAQ